MSYKSLNFQQDFAPLSTAVNEVIVVTGSLVGSLSNIKSYKNISSGSAAIDLGGYFQTVYDSAPSSALSTPLFDITFGMTTGSTYNVASTTTSSQTEKVKIHRQMPFAYQRFNPGNLRIGRHCLIHAQGQTRERKRQQCTPFQR